MVANFHTAFDKFRNDHSHGEGKNSRKDKIFIDGKMHVHQRGKAEQQNAADSKDADDKAEHFFLFHDESSPF